MTFSKALSSPLRDPLRGVNVLDLTRIVAGPYCTQLLGDLGARIFKIEHPRGGDEARKWGPPYVGESDLTCYFASLNRNKRSVCVDLKSPRGVSVLRDMARKCDVLVENFVPGKLDELGLGYDRLKKIAPHLIYCSVTGFGPDGPYSKRPGYDVIAAGYGGLLDVTGEESGDPVKVGVAITDITTGLHAYGSIMAAMLLRHRTGEGQKIDCDLLSTQIGSMINLGSNYLNAGEIPKRLGTAHVSIVPYQAFKTEDGHLIVGTGSDDQFRALCDVLGAKRVSDDIKFSTNRSRVHNRKELISLLENIFRKKSTEEWMRLLEGSPFPYGPINSLDKVFDDPHVRHIKIVKELEHPTAGTVKVVGPPVKFSSGGNRVRSRPPLLGEHTRETLLDFLGYNEETVNSLKADGVIV